MNSTPGDYYDRKAQDAAYLREKIRLAEQQGASESEIKALKYALDIAEHVGD